MITLDQISNSEIEKILKEADGFSKGKKVQISEQTFASNLFYENSTRTKTSFEIAERKLGLEVIPFDINTSSVNKGESLYDTVKTMSSLGCELMIIRHPQNKFYDEIQNIQNDIINAGDGTGEHPTQTMLDLLTIQQEFGTLENLKVAIVGDISHSRVANSLSKILLRFGNEVTFSGPDSWLPKNHSQIKNSHLDTIIPEVDVLYLLRIQHERHTETFNFSAEEYLEKFGLNERRASKMKSNAIIMHPAPINRGVEIEEKLIEAKNSRIFKQMENGVYVRMAIIKNVLEKKGKIFKEK